MQRLISKTILKNLQSSHETIASELAVLNQRIADGVNSAKVNKQKAQLDKQIATFDVRIKEAKELIEKHGSEDVVLAGSLFYLHTTRSCLPL